MGIAILVGGLFLFIVIRIPICFALGASSILYLLVKSPDFLQMIPQRIWFGTNSFILIALPLFIMAGQLMNTGGITRRIIDLSLYLVRPIRGGLGEVNVVASMIFGGISGSSVADTSAIGSILIPQMKEKGYTEGFSAGVTVASSTMGMIIPPSIPMLIYAMISGASVGALFLAGLIPGMLIGFSQIVMVYILSRHYKYHPKFEKFDISEFLQTSKDGILAIIMPVVIVVTVAFGVATASESAGVAVLYALLLGIFVYKEFEFKHLGEILKRTVVTSSSVLIIIGFTTIFTWILAIEQIPTMIADFIINLGIQRFWLLLFLDMFILFIGTFVDVTPALLLFCPIFIPIMRGIGVNEIQFGAIMIVGLAIGLITPPIGMCLNACTKICKTSITNIFWYALPFLVCNVIVLLLVTYIPWVSLWLPELIMK